MAATVQDSREQPATGQGRSQFSLRGLFIHVTMCALAFALLASFPSPIAASLPPLFVVWFVIGTRGETAFGALYGMAMGVAIAWIVLYEESSLEQQFGIPAVGSWFALMGASVQAINRGYRVIGWAAFVIVVSFAVGLALLVLAVH